MKKFYLIIVLLTLFSPIILPAQNCSNLNAIFKSYESRCAATGSIKVIASGGSGSYKYRVSGPVNINFTSVDSITGLPAGKYDVEVVDEKSGCQFFGYSITLGGNYSDPRFTLKATDVSCENGSNGAIEVYNVQNGRDPFTYTIVAPSAMGIGTTSATGVFTGLKAGNYTVRLTDSCGGIQTRSVSIINYSWSIQSHSIAVYSCNMAKGAVVVSDSRGNRSNTSGIPGMLYGVLMGPGDTLWSASPNFDFNTNGRTSTEAYAKDACGKVKKVSVSLSATPSIGSTITINQKTCSSFRASVSNVKNFFSPVYYLLDKDGNEISNNTNGVFANLPYGLYSIKAVDGCTGTTIIRSFSQTAPVVSVATNVTVSDKNCNTFSASITGQSNVSNPSYKIYDPGNNLIGTNTNGKFSGLSYGDYKIVLTNGCPDTTIVRYVTASRPVPVIKPLSPSYVTCTVFGFKVGADSLYNAQYCLYDDNHNQIGCNNTGVFDNIALGDYSVEINDLCTGTVTTRTISAQTPVLTNDLTFSYSKSCSVFKVTVNTSNFKNSDFTLYDANDEVVATNTTGVFANLSYGSYYVTAHATCPDITVRKDFSAEPLKPTGTAKINTSNERCDLFDLSVSGLSNLSSPAYILKDNNENEIRRGSSGKFSDLPYGSYCVDVVNSCYVTTITVCKTLTAPARELSVSAARSCNYGSTLLNVSASVYPATIRIMNPSNVMVRSEVITKATAIDNIPDLPSGGVYTVISDWNCGSAITKTVAPVVSYINHSATVESLCPGAEWPNGYGHITANVETNAGTLDVRIIKKNNDNSFSKTADETSGTTYKFMNLEPATYIIRSYANDGCGADRFDTVTVLPYQYPDLNRTTAFQCDQNGFSVGAYVNNGVAPFTYEIMSSTPSSPSIVTSPQSSPIFNIDNGTEYQLIRLRAVDACGNATLGDASILPLAPNNIRGVTDNCIGTPVKLTIDNVINSTVTWSYKKKKSDPSATVLGNGFSYQIEPFSYQDTGYYFCDIIMNDGCVVRNYEFNLNGVCYGVLPVVEADLKGRLQNEKSVLEWTLHNGQNLLSIVVERNTGDGFKSIGKVGVKADEMSGDYKFTDDQPGYENQYRLRMEFEGGKSVYSKIVRINLLAKANIRMYPNPATDYVSIDFNMPAGNQWMVELINVAGQKTIKSEKVSAQHYTIRRTSAMPSGMYLLKVTNQKTGGINNYKVIFK